MKDLITKSAKAFATMFQDDNPADDVTPYSIGRVAFGLLFLCACFFWMYWRVDPPDGMKQTLWALMIYVTGTKSLDLGSQIVAMLGAKKTQTPPTP